jgi:cob(I)alamin adenosyltransferase
MIKIYTGFGDEGNTQLLGKKSVAKDDVHIEVIGTLDELNSHLGLLITKNPDFDVMKILKGIQEDIFSMSAVLAVDATSTLRTKIDQAKIKYLEDIIDIFDKDLAPIKNFILPGGTERAALFHIARAVCRRAERRLVSLMQHQEAEKPILVYLNRLSDLLFVLARIENDRSGVKDILWLAKEE